MDRATDTRRQASLRQQQSQYNQDQSQQRPAVAARSAQNRQQERFSLGPRRRIVNKARLAREHCNQRIGCCAPVRCIAPRTAVLLYWVGPGGDGGWWVGGGRRLARSPRWPSMVKKCNSPRLFPVSNSVLKNQPTNCSPRTRCTAVRTAAPLYCCM